MTWAGVDEAGRGPLAGPVVAAAAALTESQALELTALGLRDSKKLSPKKRELLFEKMVQLKVNWRATSALTEQIDRDNILCSTLWAMRRSVERLASAVPLEGVLVDGNVQIPGLALPQRTVVGGDDLYASISAASVIAKVLRDRVMDFYDALWPQYGFAKHKGYGTAQHRAAIAQWGPTAIHRKSFSWGKA